MLEHIMTAHLEHVRRSIIISDVTVITIVFIFPFVIIIMIVIAMLFFLFFRAVLAVVLFGYQWGIREVVITYMGGANIAFEYLVGERLTHAPF